jgi:hypothetical protein
MENLWAAVIGETKVISQRLEATRAALLPPFAPLGPTAAVSAPAAHGS